LNNVLKKFNAFRNNYQSQKKTIKSNVRKKSKARKIQQKKNHSNGPNLLRKVKWFR